MWSGKWLGGIKSRRLDCLNLANCGIHVLVTKREVVWRTSTLKCLSCESIKACQVISTDSWVVFAKNVISKLSLCRTSISCSSVLRLPDLTWIWREVGAWTRWKRIVFVKTLHFVCKLWRTIFLSHLLRVLSESLIELLLAILSRRWPLITLKRINHIRTCSWLKRCRASHSQGTVMAFANNARLVLAWAKRCTDRLIHETIHGRAEDRDTVRPVAIHRWLIVLLRWLFIESRSHGLVRTWAWASPPTLHFIFILTIVLTNLLEILADRALVVANFYWFEPIACEKRLCWPVELTLHSITAGTDTVLSMLNWLYQVWCARCAGAIPWNRISRLLFRLLLHQMIRSRTDTARVVH